MIDRLGCQEKPLPCCVFLHLHVAVIFSNLALGVAFAMGRLLAGLDFYVMILWCFLAFSHELDIFLPLSSFCFFLSSLSIVSLMALVGGTLSTDAGAWVFAGTCFCDVGQMWITRAMVVFGCLSHCINPA